MDSCGILISIGSFTPSREEMKGTYCVECNVFVDPMADRGELEVEHWEEQPQEGTNASTSKQEWLV
jgi:hypothetical protein